jgi:uncharacterized protein
VTLYLDTSALVKLLINEDGTDSVLAAVERADQLATSHITYVETHAALARMRAGGRLSAAAHRGRAKAFAMLWSDTAIVAADTDVINRAAQLADRHVLRGYDAVQLASALELSDRESSVFASWDDDLNAAALRERLALVPRA